MNVEADLKDQAKNKRLFEETLTIMKKAWTEKFFNHQGEFYNYPAPDFVWQHDMSPPNENLVDLKTNKLKKISVVPQPLSKTSSSDMASCRFSKFNRKSSRNWN